MISPGQPGREGDNMNMQEMIYQENRIPRKCKVYGLTHSEATD